MNNYSEFSDVFISHKGHGKLDVPLSAKTFVRDPTVGCWIYIKFLRDPFRRKRLSRTTNQQMLLKIFCNYSQILHSLII